METGIGRAYFVTAFCVEQDPSKLYDLCRIFCDIDSVFITGGGNMNNNVSIQITLLALRSRRHLSRICKMRQLICRISGDEVRRWTAEAPRGSLRG
jgi:hypothetical protein